MGGDIGVPDDSACYHVPVPMPQNIQCRKIVIAGSNIAIPRIHVAELPNHLIYVLARVTRRFPFVDIVLSRYAQHVADGIAEAIVMVDIDSALVQGLP